MAKRIIALIVRVQTEANPDMALSVELLPDSKKEDAETSDSRIFGCLKPQ